MKKILIIASLLIITMTMASCKVREEFKSVINDEDVKQKVNVYFFWRDGCGYCAEAKDIFKSISNSHGNCHNLVDFNIWDESKPENMKKFDLAADHFEIPEEDRGVPLIIINGKMVSSDKNAISEIIEELCTSDEYEDNFEKVIEIKE